jgi:hypothetical protein
MEKATNVMPPAFAMEVNPCIWEREHDAKVVAEMKAVAPKVRATIEKRTSSKLVMDVAVVNKEDAAKAPRALIQKGERGAPLAASA